MPDSQRLFFALWPDDAVRCAMAQTARLVFGLTDPAAPARYHLTLLFLGNVTDAHRPLAEEIGASVRVEPFELVLDRSGAFGKALWLGPSVVPGPLEQLGAELRSRARQCGIQHDDRPLAPHVTCLRRSAIAPRSPQVQPIRWPVRDFVLVQSRLGRIAEYRVLSRWPLIKAGHPGQQRE